MDFGLIYTLLVTKLIPALATLIGFGALIAIHELGHFLFCKLFNIHTPTFSIGFGPELFSRKIGDTHFRLALIPFGGYCEIAGHEEVGQGDQAHALDRSDRSFDVKPYWQKLLVMLGGIICNLLFAYTIACTLFIVGKHVEKPGVYIVSVLPSSPAQHAGLEAKDRVLALGKHQLATPTLTGETASTLVIQELASKPGQQINLLIERDGQEKIITATLASKPAGTKMIGSLGVNFGFNYPITQLPFFQAIKAGIEQTNNWIRMIVQSLTTLASRRSLDGAGGPVMIFSQIFSSAQNGLLSLLVLLALISINLALLNLLPIGALDGGQVLFITIEAAIRRKIPDTVKIGINLASWAFFIILTLILTYRDIIALFVR
ncbi:MAG: M50 family metallopeptidase [Candidatus Babeliales bacterium]